MLNVELLQQFENQIAKKQERKPAQVVSGDFPDNLENIVSMYERNKHQIIMNNQEMQKLNDIELIATVLHEGRHAYQWLQISNPNDSIEDKELIARWKDEFLTYEQKLANENHNKYLRLAIEIDAIAYSSLNIFNMTKLQLAIDPEIKEEVSKRKAELIKRNDNF